MRAIYTTEPRTGVSHLVDAERYRYLCDQIARGTGTRLPLTYCGRIIGPDWSEGDETPNGIAATCFTCQRHAADTP